MATIRDQEFEIHKHHREVQIKHSYYLLAVSVAAIGFSVQKTLDVGFKLSQMPLAAAVILWGISFVSGCVFTRRYLDAYDKNAQFLELFEEDEDHEYSKKEERQQIELEKEMNIFAGQAYWWGEVQFYSLVFGGAAFLLWHLIEMAYRT